MEFIATNFSYFLPLKSDDGNLVGITKEVINLSGNILSKLESPNLSTRELLSKHTIQLSKCSVNFRVYISANNDLGNEIDKSTNTKMRLQITENTSSIFGEIYVSKTSFYELKSLANNFQIPNAFIRFELIAYGDKVKSNLPIEIDFACQLSGFEINFSTFHQP